MARRFLFLAWFSFVVFFVAQQIAFDPFLVDDALIVARYAANAAAGEGLVYNPGEYVSALTSPLHAILMTGLTVLFADPVAVYRALAGALPILGTLYALARLRLPLPRAAIFLVFTLGSPFVALWSRAGLETPVLTAFLTGFAVQLVLLADPQAARRRETALAALFAALAVVTRMDAALVLAPFVLALIWINRDQRWFWGQLALAAVPLCAWLGFSAWYYHDLLPTSAYLKLGPLSVGALDNLATVINYPLVTGLAIAAIWLRPFGGDVGAGPVRVLRHAALAAAVIIPAYGLVAAGQHMMFGYRYFVPYAGMIGLALAVMPLRSPAPVLVAIVVCSLMTTLHVARVGMTPRATARLPVLGAAFAEMGNMTPRAYGALVAQRRQEAAAIRAHWHALGRPGRPRAFLYTGGMGYYLPEFDVFEALVSYRHFCRQDDHRMITAAHYIQDLPILPVNAGMRRIWQRRDDMQDRPVSETDVFLYAPTHSRFFYGDRPEPFRFPSHVDVPCRRDATG